MESNLQPLERAQLREFLVSHFAQDELELLAFDLGVDYELLNYQNKQKLSQALVAHFTRRDQLACLLTEIIRRHPHSNLSHLLEKLPACVSNIKSQIIIHTSLEVTDEIEAFWERLAQKHNLSREEVNLIAVAQGSLHLLLCLPDSVVASLQQPDNQPAANPFSSAIEITLFAELSARSQNIWRMIAREWPPVTMQNKIVPRITWQKAAEIYQLKEKDALMRTLVAGDQFGAHEVRATLTALSGYAQLLAMTGDLNEKQTHYVDNLVQSSEDLSETLTVLYYLISSIDEEITVQSLIQYLLPSISFIAEQGNIQLDLALAEGLAKSQLLVRGNLTMLTKSVMALVQNAVQYSPENGRILLSATIIDNQLLVQVQDEGETISVEEVDTIFEPFGQRPYATVRDLSHLSSGLGLTVAKLVTEQMDGKIWVEPQSKPGNTFCIMFPLLHEEAG